MPQKTLSKAFPSKNSKDTLRTVWVWNHALTEEEIEKQLSMFADKGFHTVIIRPTIDLIPAYLSDGFFEYLNIAIEKALELGIKIKVSECLAGGNISTASIITSNRKDMRLDVLNYEETVNTRNTRSFAKDTPEPENVVALATRLKNKSVEQSSVKELKSKAKQINWQAPHGEWIVLVFAKHQQYLPLSGYQMDFFNKKASDLYISTLFDTYKKNIPAKHWGKVFSGFVFELPYMGQANKEFFISESLDNKFISKFKKNFFKILPLLIYDGGKATGALRNKVYSFIQDLFVSTFLSNLIKAGTKHKLDNEYHYWNVNPYFQNDSLPLLPSKEEFEHINGTFTGDSDNINTTSLEKITIRNIDKNSNTPYSFLGRSSLSLSSTLQSLRLEMDKKVFIGHKNWTFDGMAYKPEQKNHPFVPNNPFYYSGSWKYMDRLLSYSQTLNAITGKSFSERKILIVYPEASILSSYSVVDKENYNKVIDTLRECEKLCDKICVDYDVVREEDLAKADFLDGKLKLDKNPGSEQYSAILAPRLTTIDTDTLKHFKKALSKNVHVFWIGTYPTETVQDGLSLSIRKQAEALKKKYQKYSNLFDTPTAAEKTLSKIFTSDTKAISIAGNDINDTMVAHYTGKQDVCFLLNKSKTTAKNISVTINTKDKIFLADCDKQELHKFPIAQSTDNKYQFNLELQPRQLYTFVLSKTNLPVAHGHIFETLTGLERKYRIVFKDKWDFKTTTPNVLPLTFWNSRISGSKENKGMFRIYETYFEIEEEPKEIRLLLDGIINIPTENKSLFNKNVEVAINGTNLKDFQSNSPYGERSSGSNNLLDVDITPMLHKGFNRITIRSKGNFYSPLVIDSPPFIKGNFVLKRGKKGWMLCNADSAVQKYSSWTDAGFPYYSGTAIYSKTFERPDVFNRLVIKFKKVEEIAAMKINGQLVAEFPYEPMECDVTHLTLQGKNEIAIEVTNTIDNEVKMNLRPSGLLGEVTLDVY